MITTPGVLRGFDAMHLPTDQGARLALLAADTSVPYRTSAVPVDRYDGPSVAQVLERDFAEHGAPLVLRADRASCHTAPEVGEVLRRHGVLLLQGPPRYPGTTASWSGRTASTGPGSPWRGGSTPATSTACAVRCFWR